MLSTSSCVLLKEFEVAEVIGKKNLQSRLYIVELSARSRGLAWLFFTSICPNIQIVHSKT